jgi:hypothetical protein
MLQSFRPPGTTNRSWITYAGGVSALIEAWGPDSIVSEFDVAIFACQFGAIVRRHSGYGLCCMQFDFQTGLFFDTL